MKKKAIAFIVCLSLIIALILPMTVFASQNGYVIENVSVTVPGHSVVKEGPYSVPSYVDAIAIRLNKQIDPNYLIVHTCMEAGLHPLELEYGFEEVYGSSYFYWFYMPTNYGYIDFIIANGDVAPTGYRYSVVY